MTKVFFSYSHKDEALRNELDNHFGLLKREALIDSWHDRRIGAGNEVDEEVFNQLNQADLILLLVSADFINSDYCFDREMTRAMERHHNKEAKVIPVILRHCEWRSAPFGKLLALPRDGKPVMAWKDKDEALLYIAQEVRRAVEEVNVQSSQVIQKTATIPLTKSTLNYHKGDETQVKSDGASQNKVEIFLSCEVLAEAGDTARNSLISAYNKLELARFTKQPLNLALTSAIHVSLTEKFRKLSAHQIADDMGETELSLAKETQRLKELAAPFIAIGMEPNINSWLSSVNDRVALAQQFIRVLSAKNVRYPNCTTFDLVLRPASDVSFTFNMPNEIVDELIDRNGFEKAGGKQMITANWGFDIFDLPLKLVLSEVLPRLIQFVYLPRWEGIKNGHSNEHLLNLRNWTFGLH